MGDNLFHNETLRAGKLIFVSWLISACAPGYHTHKSFENVAFNLVDTNGGSATTASTLEAFKTTLHPTLTQNCGGCHGVGQAPLHSVNDATAAMNTIVNASLVDFANPPNSRLVQKIRGGHNGFATSIADQIQAQIIAWIAGANSSLPQVSPLTASYQSIHDRILVPKCLSCHSGPAAREVALDTHARVASKGNDILQEVEDGSMPPGPNDLTPIELAVLREWIQAGAPNN